MLGAYVCSQFVDVRIENWNQRRTQNSCQISSSIINPHPSSALPNRGKTITIRRLWMASGDASLEFIWFCVRWSASYYIFKTVKYEDQLSVVLRTHGKETELWTALRDFYGTTEAHYPNRLQRRLSTPTEVYIKWPHCRSIITAKCKIFCKKLDHVLITEKSSSKDRRAGSVLLRRFISKDVILGTAGKLRSCLL